MIIPPAPSSIKPPRRFPVGVFYQGGPAGWHNNALKRLTKEPKLHFLDSGLLAALTGLTPEKVAADRSRFGAILETFVFSEILKLTGWSDDRFSLSHFRDKELGEVDIVLEDRDGRIVGLEVKASATVRSEDFRACANLPPRRGNALRSAPCSTIMSRP